MGPVLVGRHERQYFSDGQALLKELEKFAVSVPFRVGITYIFEYLVQLVEHLWLEFLTVPGQLLLHDGASKLILHWVKNRFTLILDHD